jgi:hypothetical protein
MEDYDRVRVNTAREVRAEIDNETALRVHRFEGAGPDAIAKRMDELDREWGMERMLELNASVIAFAGVVLGIVHDPYWLIVPLIVLPFLFLHAVQGWCPPVPLFRRLGYRTRQEIDREKYALKTLRGDFDDATAEHSAASTLKAVWT